MRRPTDVVDSHPALRDRLGALGIDGAHALAAAIAPFGRSAAEELLADRLPAVQRDMSYEWRERTNHDWKVWRQESAEREETAAALRARRDAGEALTPDEEWALLEAVVDAEGVQSASAAVYAFVASHPAHILGRWTRARLALEQGDESGLADLEELVRLDDMAIPPAGSLAYDWLQSRGRTAEADAWSERMERFEEALQRDRDERSKFDERDSLDPAGLGDDALEALRTALQGIAGVESAWIVRKRLTARPHVPLHVLVCVPGRQWRGRSRVNRQQELLQALLDHVPMPPNSLFIVTSDEALALVDRLRRYGGSPLVGR